MRIAGHLQSHWDFLIENGQVNVQDKFADIPEPETKRNGKQPIDSANYAGRPNGRGKGSRFSKFSGGRGKGSPFSSSDGSKKTRQITSSDVCFACGGLGHMAKIFDKQKDMHVPYCPTLIRKVDVSKDILSKITYPHIANPKAVEQAKQADAEEDEGEVEAEEEESSDSEEMEQCNYFFGQI